MVGWWGDWGDGETGVVGWWGDWGGGETGVVGWWGDWGGGVVLEVQLQYYSNLTVCHPGIAYLSTPPPYLSAIIPPGFFYTPVQPLLIRPDGD